MEHIIEMIFTNQQANLNVLLTQIRELQTKTNITISCIVFLLIIGIIILLNQRKIRKELRQLREMMENQDKPNGETYESDTE